jgi:hypothetical protein
VALDTASQPKTATYRAGALSTWTSLGGSGFNGMPAVVVLPGDRLRVFVRAGDGTIMTKQQDPVTGAWPSAWDPVGGAVAAGSPTAVLSPTSGRIELIAHRADGHYLTTGETEQASGVWRPWQEVVNQFGEALVAATDPTAVTYTDCGGRTWGFVVRNSDQQNSFQPARDCLAGLAVADSKLDAPPSFSFHPLPKPQP